MKIVLYDLHPIFSGVADTYWQHCPVENNRWAVQAGYVYAWLPCIMVRQPTSAEDFVPEGLAIYTPKNFVSVIEQSQPGEEVSWPTLDVEDYLVCGNCHGRGDCACSYCDHEHACGQCEGSGHGKLACVRIEPMWIANRWLRMLDGHGAKLYLPRAAREPPELPVGQEVDYLPLWFKIAPDIEGIIAQVDNQAAARPTAKEM